MVLDGSNRLLDSDTIPADDPLHGVTAGATVEAVPACRRHVEAPSCTRMPRAGSPVSIRIRTIRL